MTRLHSASIALATILLASCGQVDSATPRAATGDAADQSQRAPANTSAGTPAAPATTTPAVNPMGAATLEFKKHIDSYVKIHNEAESKVPNLKKTDDPKEIADREK